MRFTITETHETETHKASHNKARAQRRAENPPSERYKNVPTEFVCVDGEGQNFECSDCECSLFWQVTDTQMCSCRHHVSHHAHRYVLLGVGDQQISSLNGLTWEECFEFLWSQFRTGSVAYTGFFLGYDFIQMFRSLPEERARMLLTKEGRAKRAPKSKNRVQPFPVRCGDWEFDILGTKRLKIRKSGSKRWMNICDTGPFFQKSFLAVINPAEWSDPIVTPEEYQEILDGKSRRSSAILDRSMRHYNARENEILARILCKLNEGFQSLGIHLSPGQWFGPGQAAQAWLEGRAITNESLQEVTPPAVLEAAIGSYFGGWFEIMCHGLIPGITWEYDINSAYPHIISQLPCLEHGEWVRNGTADTPYSIVYARIRGRNRYIGTMLHRDADGNISRPIATEGWYWESEIVAAQSAGLIHGTPDILDRWSYIPCDCPSPLREVRDIYALRKQVGKKTPLGIACKLVPNSLYGKFAQSIGNPKYANPIYASLITSGCRTMILQAIASHPEGAKAVLMVATDGVYFRSQHPSLPLSGNLGGWEEGQKTNIRLFKPGVYWDDAALALIAAGEPPVFKARGVNARDFGHQLAEVDRQFAVMTERLREANYTEWNWPTVRFPLQFSMVSAVQALQWNKWELAGTLVKDPSGKQSAMPDHKRYNPKWDMGIIRTQPPLNDPYEPSHPYTKRFGIEDPFSDDNLMMEGITPDGLPMIVIREALGM